MRRGIFLLCLTVLFCLLPAGVLAQETTVDAAVPGVHTVSIQVTGGIVSCAGQLFEENGSVFVVRRQRQEYYFTPDRGKIIQSIWYNGRDVTGEIQDGVWVAPPLTADASLKAEFIPAVKPAETGQASLWPLVNVAGFCLVVCFLGINKKKRTQIPS